MNRGYYSLQQLTDNIQPVSRTTGVVAKVILNDKDIDGDGVSDIGSIYVRLLTDGTSNISNLLLCKPRNFHQNDIPIVNEVVEVITTATGGSYYERIYSPNINSSNAVDGADDLYQSNVSKPSNKTSRDYREVSETNIPNSSNNPNSSKVENKYFRPAEIAKLNLYEGDKVIESRFGQSIRFSGFNNEDRELSPTTIIRNRQNDLITDSTNSVDEDINRDGSIIVLSSNKYKLGFKEGRVDDKGKSDFETSPIKASIPQEYVGVDQMLLNSDRIILSSKSQEMLFFSRGNISFITDGKLTIDAGLNGADLDFGDDVNITTDRNNGNFSVQTGTGNILLNTTQTNEPLIRGNQLVSFLQTLTDILIQFQTIGPNGPNTTAPSVQTQITELQAQLDNLKSTLNFTE